MLDILLNYNLHSHCKLMILDGRKVIFSIGSAVGPVARFLSDR